MEKSTSVRPTSETLGVENRAASGAIDTHTEPASSADQDSQGRSTVLDHAHTDDSGVAAKTIIPSDPGSQMQAREAGVDANSASNLASSCKPVSLSLT